MGQRLSDISVFVGSIPKWLDACSPSFEDGTCMFLACGPSANLQAYQYQGIKDENSIRMLRLQRGEFDEPLEGALEVVKVDNADVYEPLSYVWGEPKSSDDGVYAIALHDGDRKGSLEITKSLYSALKRLRYRGRERRIWVDQVKFMNTIYKNASHVLVWLGPDEKKHARAVFESIHKLSKAFENEKQRQKRKEECNADDITRQIKKSKKFLNRLADLPWFKRGWIVQEIGTETLATMFWGEAEIAWATVYEVCESLTDYHHLRRKLDIRTANIKYLFKRFVEPDLNSYHANRFNFIYELHRARELELTDKRDHVFAWLGHYSVRGTNQELAKLEADYKKSLIDVYIDVARRALEGEKGNKTGSGLIALAAVQHKSLPSKYEKETQRHNLESNTDEGKLPTWVPDWRTYQSFILSEPISPHRAHGNREPELEISGDHRILKIRGVEYDTLEECSRQLQNKDFYTEPRPEATKLAVEYLWEDICGKAEQYPDGQEAIFAMMQTLSNGCVQTAGREEKDYYTIPRDRWVKEHARYLALAQRSSDALCPELLAIARNAADDHQEEIWSRAANGASKGRKFARTSKGYYVLGPKVMEKGDVVCVLFGGKLPFCLRPCNDGKFLLVGECYVHGLMKGEAIEMLERKQLSEREFEIV